MQDKTVLFFIYFIIAIGAAIVMPFFKEFRLFPSVFFKENKYSKFYFIGYVIFIIFLILNQKNLKLYFLLIGVLLFFISKLYLKNEWNLSAYVFIGILVSAFLPWWLRIDDSFKITINQTFNVLVLTVISYLLLNYQKIKYKNIKIFNFTNLIYLFFIISTFYIVYFLAPKLALGDIMAWHHWSAYIGPAQLVLSGALPLHDIPVQYGLGPTLLLSQGCRVNCWESMFWLTSTASFIFTLTIGWISLFFIKKNNITSIFVTLILVLVCCLLWTSAPRGLLSPITTPSTSGLRFLPGVIMLAWTLNCEKNNNSQKKYANWGHFIWLACFFWSPEAGVHASAVWVPYYLWMNNTNYSLKGMLTPLLQLIFVFICGLITFLLLYKLTFKVWPIAFEYIVYLIYPPGPLPVNPFGPLVFLIFTLIIWFISITNLYNNSSSILKKMSWLVALLLIVNFTYYLGRSHDNNILNLMPYIFLLLIATRSISQNLKSIYIISSIMLSFLLGLVALFGINKYNTIDYYKISKDDSIHQLVKSFNYKDANLKSSLNFLLNNYQEQVEIISVPYLIPVNQNYLPWSAIHSVANYYYIPDNIRETYLKRVSKRINKSGWVLYKKDDLFAQKILIEYKNIYNETQTIDFEKYIAIRFTPK